MLLLWLYLSAIAVMLGAELNAELERQSAIRAGEVQEHHDEDQERSNVLVTAPETERAAGASEWTNRMDDLRRSR